MEGEIVNMSMLDMIHDVNETCWFTGECSDFCNCFMCSYYGICNRSDSDDDDDDEEFDEDWDEADFDDDDEYNFDDEWEDEE